MKKLLLFLLTMFVLSCTSLKDPESDDLGILLAPHTTGSDVFGEHFGRCIYGLENLSSGKITELRISHSNGAEVQYLSPGEYRLNYYRFDYDDDYMGEGSMNEVNDVYFSIYQGEISILQVTFRSYLELDQTTGKQVFYYGIENTQKDDKDMALNHISDWDGFELWHINN